MISSTHVSRIRTNPSQTEKAKKKAKKHISQCFPCHTCPHGKNEHAFMDGPPPFFLASPVSAFSPSQIAPITYVYHNGAHPAKNEEKIHCSSGFRQSIDRSAYCMIQPAQKAKQLHTHPTALIHPSERANIKGVQ